VEEVLHFKYLRIVAAVEKCFSVHTKCLIQHCGACFSSDLKSCTASSSEEELKCHVCFEGHLFKVLLSILLITY